MNPNETTSMKTDMTIANTILDQLGGRKLIAMTGARQFLAGNDYLSFRIPGTLTRKRINAVQIRLEPSDTYTVFFFVIRGTTIKEVARHEDVYCDSLCELFRDVTGLETRMPRVIFG
jgi:hypothetical protein